MIHLEKGVLRSPGGDTSKAHTKGEIMVSGIYVIRNRVDGKRYVGKSEDIRHRWADHRNDLAARRHHSKKLENAWHKHGADAFEFEIIEIVEDVERLDAQEAYHYDLLQPEYNIYPPGGARRSHMPRIRALVEAWRLEGRVIRYQDLAEYLDLSASTVGNILRSVEWWTEEDGRIALHEAQDRGRIQRNRRLAVQLEAVRQQILDILVDWYASNANATKLGYRRIARKFDMAPPAVLLHLRRLRLDGRIDDANRPKSLAPQGDATPLIPQFAASAVLRAKVIQALATFWDKHPQARHVGCTTLARMIGVTDQAVWKHLRALRVGGIVDGHNRLLGVAGASAPASTPDVLLRPGLVRSHENRRLVLDAVVAIASETPHLSRITSRQVAQRLPDVPFPSLLTYLKRYRTQGVLDEMNRPVQTSAVGSRWRPIQPPLFPPE